MRIFRNKEDGLKFRLSFFLIAGSILGTLFCNMMTDEMKLGLTVMEKSSVTVAALSKMDFTGLLVRILPKRLWTLGLVLLVAATPMASVLMMLVAGYCGFSNAVMVCSLTMGTGVLGIVRYLVLGFPQCLFYIPAAYLLLWWMPANEKHLTVLSVLFLIGLTALGAVVESLVNPWVIAIMPF